MEDVKFSHIGNIVYLIGKGDDGRVNSAVPGKAANGFGVDFEPPAAADSRYGSRNAASACTDSPAANAKNAKDVHTTPPVFARIGFGQQKGN